MGTFFPLEPYYHIGVFTAISELSHSKIDGVEALRSKAVMKALPRYSKVVLDGLPANFQVARKIVFDLGGSMDATGMWEEHERLVRKMKQMRFLIDKGKLSLSELEIPRFSLLDLKIMLARELAKGCSLCERRCGIDRMTTHRGNEVASFSNRSTGNARGVSSERAGFCGVVGSDNLLIDSESLNMNDEKHISPSHSIFLMGCNLRCVYCKDHEISRRSHDGISVLPKDLAGSVARRWNQGSRNVNWVGGEPTPQLLPILSTMKHVGSDVNVPQVWNSNFYMSEETMKLLDGVVDVYMPDFKYGNDTCARHLSGAERYFEIVSRNHLIAARQGELSVRHLVLPGHVECCTKPVLKWISGNVRKNSLVNVMDQYEPNYKSHEHMDLKRRPEREEISEALNYAKKLKLNYIF
jgi:putative pyruvate formate lyase activating enzyme